MRVQAMSPDDLPDVIQTENGAYDFPWSLGNFSDCLAQGYDAWRAHVDIGGKTVAIGHAVLMWAPDEVHLLNLSIGRQFQRNGYGRAFLRWLCNNLASRNAGAMLLEVRESNRAAYALYRSEGFSEIGRRKAYYPAAQSQREDAVVMLKKFHTQELNVS